MAAVYDVDLRSDCGHRGAGPAFRDSLNTVLTHLIHVSVAKKRMTLVKLHGPVYPEEKIS
jgi:hypothetical protein